MLECVFYFIYFHLDLLFKKKNKSMPTTNCDQFIFVGISDPDKTPPYCPSCGRHSDWSIISGDR